MAMRWPNRLKQALAVCNSLTLIGRNQLVGDDADKQAFKAVEARFLVSQDWLESETCVLCAADCQMQMFIQTSITRLLRNCAHAMALSDSSACISARGCYAAGIAVMFAQTDTSLCCSLVSGCMCIQVDQFI